MPTVSCVYNNKLTRKFESIRFRDLNEGALPTKVKDYSCLQKGYINREDFAKSVNKLISMETEVHRQKKKRKNRKRNKDQEKGNLVFVDCTFYLVC